MCVHSIQAPLIPRLKAWDMPLVEVLHEEMLSAASDQASKSNLFADAAPYSEAHLKTRPCSSLGTRLNNSLLGISVVSRLSAPVCSLHVCVCSAYVDITESLGLSCGK
jgi:hypothetical protein